MGNRPCHWSGYSNHWLWEVVKTGYLTGIDGKYRLKDDFSVGLEFTFARLVKDKEWSDSFDDARLTVAPILVVAEKKFSSSNLQPYIAAGLGISFFNFRYEVSPTEGHAENNVSFTMSPQIGLSYRPYESSYTSSKRMYCFLQTVRR
jgi:hypothetical protein